MAITIPPSRSDGGSFAIRRVVTTCSVRSRPLGSTLGAAMRPMVGGERSGPTKHLAEGRQDAEECLIENARREARSDHRLPVRHFRDGHVRDGDLHLRHRSSEGIMRVTGLTANLPVADIATASEFYLG